ncbi:MAG: hypothetical protein F4103_19280 [Boseongicola sp. SB0673_bin_14]|nr:hypothetical protein [Boseongicola sp. SB0667_bin_21]MYI70781.1 hypothetical protein [Boseongicola sp. SB0673_bin_14]
MEIALCFQDPDNDPPTYSAESSDASVSPESPVPPQDKTNHNMVPALRERQRRDFRSLRDGATLSDGKKRAVSLANPNEFEHLPQ